MKKLLFAAYLLTMFPTFSSSEPAFVPDHTTSKPTTNQSSQKRSATEYSFHIAYFEKQTDGTEKKCAETIVGAKTLDEAITKTNHYLATTIPLEKGYKIVKITPTVISGGKAQRWNEISFNSKKMRMHAKNTFKKDFFIKAIDKKLRAVLEQQELSPFMRFLKNWAIGAVILFFVIQPLVILCIPYFMYVGWQAGFLFWAPFPFSLIIPFVLSLALPFVYPVALIPLALWTAGYYIYFVYKLRRSEEDQKLIA